VAACCGGTHDTIGSLSNLGPGFYPAVLGALLTLVGLLIVGTALTASPTGDDAGTEPIAARTGAAAAHLSAASWRSSLSPG